MRIRARYETRMEGCPNCTSPAPAIDSPNDNMQGALYAVCESCGYRTEEVWLVPRWHMLARVVRRWNLQVYQADE